MNKKHIFFLLFIPYYTSPTVIWNNIMSTGTASAFNEDVQINGDTELPAEIITIVASDGDVTISMLNGPHTVYGTKEDDAQTVLVLIANYPWKIEIVVSEDLRFVGVENDLTTPIIIQERCSTEDSALIQWTIAEHKNVRFGPSDEANFGGADLQIVCDTLYNMPRHIFKVNGSPDNPHIFFSRNSSLTILQENVAQIDPFRKDIFFDVSNGQPRNHLVYFKDGTGLLLESFPTA